MKKLAYILAMVALILTSFGLVIAHTQPETRTAQDHSVQVDPHNPFGQ